MSLTTANPVTADQLLAMPDDGFRYELVKGELIRMSPTGHEHGIVAMEIAGPLHAYVKKKRLGRVYAAETGFLLSKDPDTVRAPDAAFVKRERIRRAGPVKGYWIGAPNLAIEVESPGDTAAELYGKVVEWLAAGALMVWVVSPKQRTVSVYRSPTDVSILTDKDTLDGADVVPGFQISVGEIFGA
ncbi:MAG TPA: Uma2 family endonuclease [Pyrinomonadaceae bacterium]|nr:Uma2 family endonuclease [Pyrinomonadaceae bacterium]